MEGFYMRAKDQLKLEIICKVADKRLSRAEANVLLKVSERTLRRYISKYEKLGIGFLRHGNCLRKPVNKLSEDLKFDVQALMKDKYYDFNLLHAMEKIKEEIGQEIKRETFRRWCHEIKMVKRSKRRRGRPRYYRERMSQAGLLLQMDGSTHRWFGGRESCLVAIIDDATSEVLYAGFFEGETVPACMTALKAVIEKKGIFKLLYVDRAGVYGGIKRTHFSQVERALNELGSEVIYAHSPEAKGRIERLFGTLQDRLVAEMRLNKIRTIEQANEYLQTVYLPHLHNPRYMVQPANPHSAFVSLHPKLDLESIFCIKEYRIVGRDHTLSLGGNKYLIADQLKYSIHKQRIEIRFSFKGTWRAFFAGQQITLVPIKKQPLALASNY